MSASERQQRWRERNRPTVLVEGGRKMIDTILKCFLTGLLVVVCIPLAPFIILGWLVREMFEDLD